AAFDNRDDLGVIHEEDAIGEQLVTSPAGAVAFIGNTRLGWGAPGSTSSVSQYFDRQFFDALFGEDLVMIGEAFDDSRIDNIPFISYAAFRYVIYGMCLLGDPAMPVWRSVPSTLDVECDSIFCGEMESHHVHVSSGGIPVKGARVSLSCDSPPFYYTTFTDAAGGAYISVPQDTSASALLSVWAPDHHIHTDTVEITPTCEARLTFLQMTVDDDSIGSSRGDSDGIIESGEKIEFDLVIKNEGSSTAFNTILASSSSDPYITVYHDTISLGDIPSRACLILEDAVVMELSDDIPDGYPLQLDFALISEGMHWSTSRALHIEAPDLGLYSWAVIDTVDGNGNGCLEGWEFLN
ncbi:MAG TPA: C25 family cysteine peptidase, partial [Candidatus Krumholzibacterium sp.]|nr:C25 family cysteine peptidase [Candidatus Krumholzibacterium sp.]